MIVRLCCVRSGFAATLRSDQKIHDADAKPDDCANKTPAHHANPVSLRKEAVMTTIASDNGRKTFQPRRINWS